MKTLYVLSGIPGSGKSTWAKKFASEHPENTKIVSSDDIRMEIGGKFQYFAEEDRVRKIFYGRLNQFSSEFEDINVIADSTCLQNQFRITNFVQAPHYDKYILVVFDVDPEISKERNSKRKNGKIVDAKVVEGMIKEFEIPNQTVIDVFDEVITIH